MLVGGVGFGGSDGWAWVWEGGRGVDLEGDEDDVGFTA